MTSPYRLYKFTADDTGAFSVGWEDHWYNQFEAIDMTVASKTYPLSDAFPLPSFTYTARNAADGTAVQNVTIQPYGPGYGSVVSVGAVAPGLLGVQVDFTYFETVEIENGHPVGTEDPRQVQLSVAVDLTRRAETLAHQQEILWDYAYTYDGLPALSTVGSGPPTQLTFPGDYRLPSNAQTTRALTDDELWAVTQLAAAVLVDPVSMLGILFTLTGARRNAYHPAGNYGITNLTADQITAGGIADVTDFINASVHRQLAVTQTYLTGLTPAVRGILPVFFTLATGTPVAVIAAGAQFNVGGVAMTAAQATTRITGSVNEIRAEVTMRMPDSVVPTISAAGSPH